MGPTIRIGRAGNDRVERERAEWHMSSGVFVALLIAPLLVQAAFLTLAVLDAASYRAITDEDGIIEWLQFAALLVAGGAFVVLARQLRSSGRLLGALVAVLAGAVILVVAGEEISWGQRVFGWATPDVLQVENVQGETNFHNLHVAALVVRVGQLGAAAYGVLIPLAAIFMAATFRRVDPIFVPPLALVTSFLPLAVYWVLRVPFVPSFTMTRFSEIPELTFYIGLVLVAVMNLRREAARGDLVAVTRRATMRA